MPFRIIDRSKNHDQDKTGKRPPALNSASAAQGSIHGPTQQCKACGDISRITIDASLASKTYASEQSFGSATVWTDANCLPPHRIFEDKARACKEALTISQTLRDSNRSNAHGPIDIATLLTLL